MSHFETNEPSNHDFNRQFAGTVPPGDNRSPFDYFCSLIDENGLILDSYPQDRSIRATGESNFRRLGGIATFET